MQSQSMNFKIFWVETSPHYEQRLHNNDEQAMNDTRLDISRKQKLTCFASIHIVCTHVCTDGDSGEGSDLGHFAYERGVQQRWEVKICLFCIRAIRISPLQSNSTSNLFQLAFQCLQFSHQNMYLLFCIL